jgi:hypothetical protein
MKLDKYNSDTDGHELTSIPIAIIIIDRFHSVKSNYSQSCIHLTLNPFDLVPEYL